MQTPGNNLGSAFRKLARSFDDLATSLEDLATRLGSPIYRRFDEPFGSSDEARKIWIRYRQYTTRN